MIDKIDRTYLQKLNKKQIGHEKQADVYIINFSNKKYVVKDISKKNLIYKLLIGRYLLKREYEIYKKLEGLEGIPKVFYLIDKDAFLMEYVEGIPLNQLKDKKEKFSKDFFEKLHNIIEHMHKRGIAHVDLKKKSNILMNSKGNPVILDFGVSMINGKKWNFPFKWLFKQLCLADFSALAKLKKYFLPESLTEEDIKRLNHYSLVECIARIYNELYRILKGKGFRFLRRWKKKKNKQNIFS